MRTMSAGRRANTSRSCTVTRPCQSANALSMGLGGAGARRPKIPVDRGASSTAQRSMSASEARLEQPHRAAVPLAPLLQLFELLLDELLHLARLELGHHRALQLLEQLRIPDDEPAVEQRRTRRVVLARERQRLRQRARRES